MNPGDTIALSIQGNLALLSFLVAVFGAYIAMLAAPRIYAANRPSGIRPGYLCVAALALGGVGIWSMHFIGMQAQRMPFDVGYGVGLTLLSLAVAVCMSGAAFWYVGCRRFRLSRCVVGGVLAGAGVAAMHYIGMAAMRMPAFLQWDAGLVALSVAIGAAAATAALWLAFNVHNEWQRILAAAVMAGAVCGMHYTGAAAGAVICTGVTASTGLQVGGTHLPYLVFLLSLLTVGAMRWQLHRAACQYRTRVAARMDALLDAGAGHGSFAGRGWPGQGEDPSGPESGQSAAERQCPR